MTSAAASLWLAPLIEAAADGRGLVMMALPEYRPSLARAAANTLGLPYRDFRAEVLAPLRWEAAKTPLERLDAYLDEGGVVINAEALLAAKPAAERRAWLARAGARREGPLAVLVLALYAEDAPPEARLARIDGALVPEESLLLRLMDM